MKHIFTQNKESKILLLILLSVTVFHCTYAQTITTNTEGIHDGFFYKFWTENEDNDASMTLGEAGNYKTTYNNVQNSIAGKGWEIGKPDRKICYEGSFDGGANSFLSVYGWTREPIIEYYVIENHGQWIPPGSTSSLEYRGTYNSDGGTYRAYFTRRTSGSLIEANTEYLQYFSVRAETRTSGTVTFANHVDAWKSFEMEMGTIWDYQIMAIEGYLTNGSSNITVSECSPPFSVEISQPISNTSFLQTDTITLQANASTNTGLITKVEFYNGDTKLGEDDSAPYTYTWNNATKGRYEITAKAYTSNDEEKSSQPVTVTVHLPEGPYEGKAHSIPGIIECEHFDEGGSGIAYRDNTRGSEVDPAPNFRREYSVDIDTCDDIGGGYNVSHFSNYEWMDYSVNIEKSGYYDVEIRVACNVSDQEIELEIDGENIFHSNITIPNTGGSQTWQTVELINAYLLSGKHTLRIANHSSGGYVNLNNITFKHHGEFPHPSGYITYPSHNDVFSQGDTLTIKALAQFSFFNIANVEFYINQKLVYTDETAPYSYDVPNLAEGTYDIEIKINHNNGYTTPDYVSISVYDTADNTFLHDGWNLIGYPFIESASLETGLSSIWQYVETVKDMDAFYDKNTPDYLINLNKLEYCKGYFVKVTRNCVVEW